ncbi:carboxypeptidase-like regulatory domain-containing protein [Mucilaginibacter myungsuensis]|uniref:Carboxypeptidase-like regulatory domain-containing protein n=1 Tax=Mucilaginibacter myungsuensis TaxID=649104 RepID=A0A929KT26_9SPHI|nr:carboxypeptidase-like regulatory domain-containing protein [Mucilaginibacter myungsuensis]MBE9661031.1 carboxypeptidase-like regulatory domain-containing protein [Mucilaginibacter myungsuensis]MDN3597175.1 carboxypeptidase-like regulatory domain-containing protein [Mucilaginibacter myungsuensis]
MKYPGFFVAFIAFLMFSVAAVAQQTFIISGTVVDENGAPAKSVTVFISGTKKITATDAEGKFSLSSITPGTFQLSVQMIGYGAQVQNVIIKDKNVTVNVALKVKATELREVVIGPDRWEERYAIFKRQFLGTSDNAKECTIINPKVISFSTNKKKLMADADEFLIIENKRLGYRIRYLLKAFEYEDAVTKYDGETSFEELEGTESEKKRWAKNRLQAYEGSMMQFLRSVYHNTAKQDGFVVRALHTSEISGSLMLSADPVTFDSLARGTDTTFISLRHKTLYIQHIKGDENKVTEESYKLKVTDIYKNKGSLLSLNLPEALIDSKGAYTDYRTFMIQGLWASMRIGDQLPFEYQPPLKN